MYSESSEKLNEFFKSYKQLSYKKDEMILRAEDTPSGVFFLKKGYVRVFVFSEAGEELSFTIFKAGEVFPITWAINGSNNKHSFEAITDVEVSRAPQPEFLAYLKENADLLFDLTSRVVNRYEGFLRRVEQLVFGNTYKRVASVLLTLSDRIGEERGNEIIFPVELTHKDIASFLGIARETASLELKRLERNHTIRFENRYLVIQNPDHLKKTVL